MVAKINFDYISRVEGFKVVNIINNGIDAIEYLKINKNIDLIILDVYMPKLNGIETLVGIRKIMSDIDIIFVTAAKEKDIIKKGLQLGAVDYLIKPFTFERIKLALEKYRQRYDLFNNQNDASQIELDKIFAKVPIVTLPKGISQFTLNNVLVSINNDFEQIINQDKICKDLSISLVTLRNYLDYLSDNDVLTKHIQYGTVGRPKYAYNKIIK